MSPKFAHLAAVAGLLVASALSSAAHASQTVQVTNLDQWYNFSVDPGSTADGRDTWINLDYATTAIARDAQDLSFAIQVNQAVNLRIVDFYAAGDSYQVRIASSTGLLDTATSTVPHTADVGSALFANTPDEAWSQQGSFSQGSWVLGPGSYLISGRLLQSVPGSDGMTSGALQISAVPEPSSWVQALAGVVVLGWLFRRQSRHDSRHSSRR